MFMNSEDFRRILEERTEMDLRSAYGRGKDEGRAEGEAKNQRNTALTMLKKGFGLDLIAEITGLNRDAVAALRAQQS